MWYPVMWDIWNIWLHDHFPKSSLGKTYKEILKDREDDLIQAMIAYDAYKEKVKLTQWKDPYTRTRQGHTA